MDISYLDYAAATPLDPAVAAAMQPYLADRFFNPSATYAAARAVRQDIEAARARVAHWLGARPTEVIFTAGGTEANNLAIRGVLAHFPEGHVVTSAIEHDSVLATAHEFGAREAPVDAGGIVDTAALVSLIDDDTVLVSVMYANNEVGTVQPIRRIATELDNIRAARKAAGNPMPLYFHVDAAQAAAYLDLHAARLGVDLMTLNAGKIYGPKQVGALYVASHVWMHAQITGGGQERGARSGTENVAGAIGFATALDLVQARRHDESRRLQGLQTLFFDLLHEAIPGVVVNGSRKSRLPNNVHITIPGQDNERLIFALDEAGILCAAGSACSASNDEPSHVLRAMGVSEKDAQASLRFTMGLHTTEEQVRTAVRTLAQLVVAEK
ncbi:MAG TPA: cysteine desulfurase family protein [Candidatus Saccharimonadales bacterium]|nr:cysteine desulfurase family protein [Candidatus Saccharimonadales bacterium]